METQSGQCDSTVPTIPKKFFEKISKNPLTNNKKYAIINTEIKKRGIKKWLRLTSAKGTELF